MADAVGLPDPRNHVKSPYDHSRLQYIKDRVFLLHPREDVSHPNRNDLTMLVVVEFQIRDRFWL